MLLAHDDIQSWASFGEPVESFVMGESRADENDIIKRAAERTTELVHKELRLARVGWPHDESIERDIFRMYFNTAQILTVCSLC